MAKKIAAFGELLWDLLPAGKLLGGAPTNFVYRINTFGDHGILLSRVGDDKQGEEALQTLEKLGVSSENIQIDYEFPTGTVKVKLDENGIPDFTIIQKVAYDHIEITAETIDAFRKADCVCFGTLVQRYGISKNTLRELIKESQDAVKFLDINLRKRCYSRISVEESLQMANILKINDEELLTVNDMLNLEGKDYKEMSKKLISEYQLKMVLCTLGPKGAFVLTNNDEYHYDPGYQVKLADTVGSGDAFSAGFIHYYLNGKPIEEALKFGNAAGAMVATTIGATAHIPKETIIEFMKENHLRNSL